MLMLLCIPGSHWLRTELWLTKNFDEVCLWKLFLGICSHVGKRSRKRGNEFYLASTLLSAPTLWRQQAGHPASVFLIPSDVGKLFAALLHSLTFSIPLERLGSLVTVMSNTCGTEQANADQHTHTQWIGDGEQRQPEPHWSFPLCMRINSSET